MHPRVIVADSHPLFWLGVETAVGSDADIAVVGQATDAEDLIEKWHRMKPNVALVDTMLPGLHNGTTLKHVLTAIPPAGNHAGQHGESGMRDADDSCRCWRLSAQMVHPPRTY